MLTNKDIENLNLGISPIDIKTEMIINAGVEWILGNTNLTLADISQNSSARLFLVKFYELQNMQTGVASESIEGLSQSYNTSNKNDMLWGFAEELLGKYLHGTVRFVVATERW